MEPKVTVILQSYNHEKFNGDAIQSVLDQTYTDFELIVVDDCSTDNSWEVINRFDDERIIKIRNPYNMRYKGWFNVIKTQAKGKYIAIHHSDDISHKDRLKKQVAFLESNPEYGAVFSHVDLIDERGNAPTNIDNYYTRGVFEQQNKTRHEWLNHFFYKGNALCHPTVLIHKNLYTDLGLVPFGFAQIRDFYMWIKVCQHKEIYIIEEKLYKYRVLDNAKNASGLKPNVIVRDSVELFKVMSLFFDITNPKDVLKVFPQAEKYLVNNEMVTEYAIARMFLDVLKPQHNLLGLQKILDLLNDEIKSAMIEEMYNYNYMDFIKESDKYDVFNIFRGNYSIMQNIDKEEKQLTIDAIVDLAIKEGNLINEKRDLPVVIYGCGFGLENYLKQISRFGIKPVALVDSNEKLWGTEKFGYKIMSFEEFKNKHDEFLVCITTRPAIRIEIKKMLTENFNVPKENIVDAVFFKYASNDEFRTNVITKTNELKRVYENLCDDKSKKVLLNILKGRLECNNDYFLSVFDENEYFNEYTKTDFEECFVDAGAYKGDSLQKFDKFVGGNFKRVICVEPLSENCEVIKNVVEEQFRDKEISIYNSGLYSFSGKIYFEESHRDDSGKVQNNEDTGVSIDCVSIDDIKTEKVSFIKMDIEGAELEALKGAEKTIRRDIPKLAICVYHKPEDLFVIPKFIMDLNLPYNYFIKHHSDATLYAHNETVFYAIPK